MILIPAEIGQNYMILQNNNINQQNSFRLSVQLTLSGLSFLVTNTVTKEIDFFSEKTFEQAVSPGELLLELKSVLNDNSIFNIKFSEINIIYHTRLYTLTPTSLFDESKSSDYLKFNSKIFENDFIAHDTLQNHDITVIYVPFININNFLFEKFGDFNYHHSTTLVLENILEDEKNIKLPKIYLNIYSNTFDLVAIKNGKLLLCNSFEYNSPEDFIYFILFCLEQLKMNPETIDLFVSGNINKGDSNHSILYKYVRNISFWNSKKDIKISDKDKSHYNLLLKHFH